MLNFTTICSQPQETGMKTSAILLLLILSFIAVTHGKSPAQLIDESCRLASKFDRRFPPQYCVSMINTTPYNRRAPDMSLHELASISLNLLDKHVSATRAKIMDLNGPGQKNPVLRDVLQHCISSYNEATHRTKNGFQHMAKREFAEADRSVSMIQGDGSDCETQFISRKVASPVTRENLDTQYLSAISCLFIRFFDRTYTPSGLLNVKHT